jgi:hypothetical protein
VSNVHATADASDHHIQSALTTAIEVATTVEANIQAFAMRVVVAIEQRLTQWRLARLSNHMLRDLGFERDWDGAIRPLRDLD